MGKLYIVHSVDVEGPMTETLHATFERMQAYGLPDSIEPSDENLNKLQNGTFRGLDPSLSQLIQNIFNKESLSYLNNWDEIDEMLSVINSEQFRNKYSDKNGNPYLLSWFIYDHHEGFTNNPRFHEVGTHKIFDHYIPLISNNNYNDEIYWHYHAPAFSGDALESNTCWSNHAMHEEIISKRIIDKQWYFSCYRAGMCIENNDSSHWLEMFIPFDFTPRMHENHLDITKVDFDWRVRSLQDRWKLSHN